MKKNYLLGAMLALGVSINALAVECVHDEAWEATGHYLGGNEIGVCSNSLAKNTAQFIEVYPPNDAKENVVWYHDGNVVQGFNNRLYYKAEGAYWAQYSTNGQDCFITDTIEVVATDMLNVAVEAIGGLCENGEVELSATVSPLTQNLGYKWTYAGSVVSQGYIDAGIDLPNFKATKAGKYQLAVENGCRTYTSFDIEPCSLDECNSIDINSYDQSKQDSIIELCASQNASEYVYVSGVTSNDVVSWFHSNDGATTTKGSAYTIANLGNVYAYYEQNGECYVSDTLYIIEQFPMMPIQMVDKYSICAGDSAQITLNWTFYTGRSFEYQWNKNGQYLQVGGPVYGPMTSLTVYEAGMYEFSTFGGTCIAPVSIFITEKTDCHVLANEEETQVEMTVVPNPVNHQLSISSTETVQEVSIRNAQAQIVYAGSGASHDVSSLTSGTYWIEVLTQSGNKMLKFIKE